MRYSAQKGDTPASMERVRGIAEELPKSDLIAVILFGSAATGKTHPLSDIDLCIITRPGISIPVKEELYSHSSRDIHISLLSDLPPAVQYRVFRDGIVLWCHDPLELHRARVTVVHAYCDVKPLIDRQTARILGVTGDV